jgi:7-carboxy-7-deazaguanine synthase
MSLTTILAKIRGLGCRRVEVTGGEPLIQPATCELLRRLCDSGHEVLLETNGSVNISGVDARAIKIIDIKCPASGEADTTRWDNLDCLIRGDEIKFVIADRADYKYARAAVERHDLTRRAMVSFSPVAERLEPAELAAWILADRLEVRLGLQLHKILWPEKTRGV